MGSLTLYVNPPHWGFSSQIRAALGGVIHLHRIKKKHICYSRNRSHTANTKIVQLSHPLSSEYSNWPSDIRPTWNPGSLFSWYIHTIIKLNPIHQGMVLVMNWLDNLWVGLQTCNTSFSAQIPRDRRRSRRRGITLDNLLISASELHHSGGYSTLWFFYRKITLENVMISLEWLVL